MFIVKYNNYANIGHAGNALTNDIFAAPSILLQSPGLLKS